MFPLRLQSIRMMQHHEVRVNGITVTLPYSRPEVYIRKFGKYTVSQHIGIIYFNFLFNLISLIFTVIPE